MVDFEKGMKGEDIEGVTLDRNEDVPEPGNFVIEKSKSSSLKKLIFLAGIIVVFLIIITILITSGTFSSKVISEKQLIVGASFAMEENKSLKVEIGEEEHEIEVQNVGEDWAEIVIRSDPIKFKLNVNDVIELDLNDDGQSDIRVKLFKIQDGKAIIAVKRIDKQSCVEDWDCGEWKSCNNDKRERICVDKNNCGSEFFIPLYVQKCVGNSPVGVNETSKEVKGMEDVINFSDNVKVKSNMEDKEEKNDTNLGNLNEIEEEDLDNNDSAINISIERIDDSYEGGGAVQYGDCGDKICDLGENTSSYLYYCPEDCNSDEGPDNSNINIVPLS